MASPWGLVDNATAGGLGDAIAEIISEQKAAADEKYKRRVEQTKLGYEGRRVGVDESQAGLQRTQFDTQRQDKAAADAEFERTLQAAPEHVKAVLRLRRIGQPVSMNTLDVAMSPEAQHTQEIGDETSKAASAAKVRAESEAQQLRDAQTLKGTPSYDDLHPKAPSAPKAAVIPSSVKLKRADMGTIDKMVNSVEALGDKIGWKGVGATGGGSGTLRGLYKTLTGRGSNEEAALRSEIGNIKGTIAKLRGGSAFSKQELEMLEAYVPTISEDASSIKTKLQGLRQWLKFQDESIREQFGDASSTPTPTHDSAPASGRVYYDAQGNPIKR